jgi:hypothetical protein
MKSLIFGLYGSLSSDYEVVKKMVRSKLRSVEIKEIEHVLRPMRCDCCTLYFWPCLTLTSLTISASLLVYSPKKYPSLPLICPAVVSTYEEEIEEEVG